jgi:crotonobetainyl-CoA:carnitine CoA-transferase CaiB-like acyl-CoA transferase
MDRLGFSFNAVSRLNPSIVYCSISAFGRKNPLSGFPGHDLNFQAMAGSLGSTRRPQVPLLQYSDYCAALYAAIGILAALVTRPRRAMLVDVPMVQSLMSLFVLPASAYITTGKPNRLGSSLILGSEPIYNLYRTLDKKYVAVAAIEEEFWRNLLNELGMSASVQSRHGSMADRRRLKTELRQAFAKKTRDEWSSILMKADTCVTPVLEVEEALDSSHSVVSRSGGGGVGAHLKLPITFLPSFSSSERAAPSLGQHTRDILREIGFSKSAIDRLVTSGAVST